jgi:hypothetical protein
MGSASAESSRLFTRPHEKTNRAARVNVSVTKRSRMLADWPGPIVTTGGNEPRECPFHMDFCGPHGLSRMCVAGVRVLPPELFWFFGNERGQVLAKTSTE